VERVDVAEAIRLVRVAMQQAAIDPSTGMIDMDLITTGRSASSRVHAAELANELRGIISNITNTSGSSTIRFDALLQQVLNVKQQGGSVSVLFLAFCSPSLRSNPFLISRKR
jgi:DNA replication licensing factor MCM4